MNKLKIKLDEIYNPSHKLKSGFYETIHHQSLTTKNKFFKIVFQQLKKKGKVS